MSMITSPPAAVNDEVKRIIEWLHYYANNRINFRLMDERRCLQPHVVLEFGNQGIFGMQVPKEYGGLGMSDRDAMKIYEYLGAVNITLAAWVGQNNSLGIRPLLTTDNIKLRERYLPALAAGRILASYALTEPHAGSFPNNIQGTIITKAPGKYLLNATKIYIGNAGWSGIINVFAKHVTQEGVSSSFTGVTVNTDAKGVILGPDHLTMGLKAAVQNKIEFRNVELTDEDLLAPIGEGYFQSHSAMQMSRMVIGAISIGAMKRCLKLMYTYAQRRDIATGKLIDNPYTLVVMNEVLAQSTAITVLLDLLIQRLEERQQLPDEMFMIVKVLSTEFLSSASDKLIQILGGRGYMENNVAAALYRDARVFRIFEGPSETLFYFVGFLFKQKTLLRFLERQLKANALVEELSTIAEKLNEGAARLDKDTSFRANIVNSRLGEITAYGALLAVVGQSDPALYPHLAMTKEWLENKFYHVKQQLTDFSSLNYIYQPKDFSTFFDNMQELNLEQRLPDEIVELDELLKI
jgi:alkylation response protein AidB-like acyl-CoA dehydrogenase